MTRKDYNNFLKAGNLIAEKVEDSICHSIGDEWQKLPQAKMINPNSYAWWGVQTMGINYFDNEARQARLLGIAMMMTMPDDMIKDKFKKEVK